MEIKFKDYKYGHRIVSIAFDEDVKRDLLEDEIDFIYIDEEKITLFPEGHCLTVFENNVQDIKRLSNYDVFELFDDGKMYRCYQQGSIDNFFFITGKCNSNCIMCPSSEYSRRNGSSDSVSNLINKAKHIPTNTNHLTITGGEPFLLGKDIFDFISFLKEKFICTEFLFLTNGRVFALEEYARLFSSNIPLNSIVAIPIHGSCATIHDSITCAEGSFKQTIIGIKRLIAFGIRIEIRIVVNKKNSFDILEIARLIVSDLKNISYVSIMAMEMTGSAYVNRDNVWLPYSDAFKSVKEAIMVLLNNEVDVKLYNFPLCVVENHYWTLCEKSISSDKVKYSENCYACSVKNACGGVFSGTFMLEKDELVPIE